MCIGRISGSKRDVGMDYCETLCNAVVRPLVKHGAEGVDAAVEAMNSYDLLREDLEALVELSSWPGTKNPMSTVESKVRTCHSLKLQISSSILVSFNTSLYFNELLYLKSIHAKNKLKRHVVSVNNSSGSCM